MTLNSPLWHLHPFPIWKLITFSWVSLWYFLYNQSIYRPGVWFCHSKWVMDEREHTGNFQPQRQVPSNWLSSREKQRIPYSWTCKVSNEIRCPHLTLRLKVRDNALILFYTQREFITIWSFLSPVDYGMFFSLRKELINYFLTVQSDMLGFVLFLSFFETGFPSVGQADLELRGPFLP